MEILNKKLNRNVFDAYLKDKKFADPLPNKIVLHHTWRPTIKSWKGEKTIQALKKYYERKGWPAGPHLFVAEDGIWLFTDMADVGIHAGAGNATWQKGTHEIQGYRVANAQLKSYSIGIEVVGDYDAKVWTGETLNNACSCLKSLQNKFGLKTDDIAFHRDYAPKSCPGKAITRVWLEQVLKS